MAITEERRAQLVRTAAREFAGSGYQRASLNAIIRDCGLSKSSFYNILDSKLALYDLVVTDISRQLSRELDLPAPATFADGDFWQKIVDVIVTLTQVLTNDDVYADLAQMLYDTQPPDEQNEAARVLASASQWISDVVRAGREAGAVRDDLPISLQGELAFTMLRTFDEWSVNNLDTIPADQLTALVDAQLAALRRLFAPA
ncbi:TetR/AcrR family transcriptional regulator [Microbacterium sp. MPKO10]|uniref:TetR/AcrR family transcriptional regulator n=1 Tax=Microbacterium sp. MPKO10 TaxID=2989818 RepID=UPI002235ABE6|nr:TetR/AcrR family transcriptional regulator [Microbacterium sp. MPKO10]MCW4458054.1 TetR/AcrR family transcriptional regulator [Microbacterium sp. MPKO10]